jgi:hypothetical protein
MIKNIINKLLNIMRFTNLSLAFNLVYRKSYLIEKGFIKSWALGYPVDKFGKNYPWWTYSFTEFFTPRLNNNMKIFEYGAGNSTIYLSQFVAHIVAVENDKNWFDLLSNQIKDNVELVYSADNEYVEKIESDDFLYDVIIIDGIYRNECAFKAINYLTDKGVIIFDDSDRCEYDKGYEFLNKNGFKRLDFIGFSPCSLNLNSTSIFYKDNNILEL